MFLNGKRSIRGQEVITVTTRDASEANRVSAAHRRNGAQNTREKASVSDSGKQSKALRVLRVHSLAMLLPLSLKRDSNCGKVAGWSLWNIASNT